MAVSARRSLPGAVLAVVAGIALTPARAANLSISDLVVTSSVFCGLGAEAEWDVSRCALLHPNGSVAASARYVVSAAPSMINVTSSSEAMPDLTDAWPDVPERMARAEITVSFRVTADAPVLAVFTATGGRCESPVFGFGGDTSAGATVNGVSMMHLGCNAGPPELQLLPITPDAPAQFTLRSFAENTTVNGGFGAFAAVGIGLENLAVDPVPVPEAATWALVGPCLLAGACAVRRRRRR